MTQGVHRSTTEPAQPGHGSGAGLALRPSAPIPNTIPAPARDVAVDAARVGCVVAVVFIHLLMVTLTADPATGEPVSVLVPTQQSWYWWATWILQIMPLFFVVGGAATAGAWRRRRAQGMTPMEYVRERVLRLIQPAALLWAVLALAVVGALAAGVSSELVTFAVSAMGMPLWFLAAYVMCQAVAPTFLALHERLGWVWSWVLLAAVVVVDLIRIGTHQQWLGLLNMVFVWPLVQNFGFFRADGWYARRRPLTLVLMATGCYGLLAWCVSSQAYAPDMLTNLNPPTVCMVVLGLAQACLLQLLTPALVWLMTWKPARMVAWVVGTRGMSIYLWHLPVIVTVVAVWFFAGGWDPQPGSAGWWVLRVPFAVICWVAVILVASVVRFAETAPVTPWGHRGATADRPHRGERTIASWVVWLGVVCAVVPPLVEIVTLLTPILTIAGALGSVACVVMLRWGVARSSGHS